MRSLKRIATITLAVGTLSIAAMAQNSMGGGQGMMENHFTNDWVARPLSKRSSMT